MGTRKGGCACGQLRYEAEDDPIIVHCCHCSFCQRENGSAFALNFLIEADKVRWTGAHEEVLTPSASGRGQRILRCPTCRIAVSSHYSLGDAVHFLRVGTMDIHHDIAPDVHIFTSTKLPWLPDLSAPRFEEFYDPKSFWSEAQMRRVKAAREAV